MKALIFDMDGTLTPATERMSESVAEAIAAVPNYYKKYLVSGSDFEKITNQIPETFLLSNFDKVFACNGTSVYNTNIDLDDETRPLAADLIHKVELLDHYSQADINHLISRLLSIASESHTKAKTGTFVEWRESQINFSVVGRNCSTNQREDYVKWDKKSSERKKIVEKLYDEFQGWGLGFNLGGQISIDITRKEWDKTYSFKHIAEKPKDCIFFGDKIVKGGNDYEIALACGKYYNVKSPKDTLKILNQHILQD
jgi:phosphomannomutase